MVEPNNTLGMFRALTWHTELQQILTSPAAEYNLLREKKLVDRTNLKLPNSGSAVRLDSGLAPDAGRYAEIEVTFALPKSATNLSVVSRYSSPKYTTSSSRCPPAPTGVDKDTDGSTQ